MSLDLEQSYKDLKDTSSACRTYTDLKNQYTQATKSFGDSLEQASQSVNTGLKIGRAHV